MNEAMEQVKNIMEQVAFSAARGIKYEIAERIEKKADVISKLLDNGQTIYWQALGTRFIKLQLLRHSLHSKAQTLYETAAMIYDIEIINVK